MTDKYYFDENDYLVKVSEETIRKKHREAKIKGKTKTELEIKRRKK